MLYLNKLLAKIKETPSIFKNPNIILILGLTNSQIKDLKKYALENQFITQSKQEYYLTEKGEEYLVKNPKKTWATSEYPLRSEVNFEYLKEEKTPSVLTKAIRNIAKHFLEDLPLKEFSPEQAILEDMKKCQNLSSKIESDILSGKRKSLNTIYEKYIQKGITKSLISLLILEIMVNSLDKIAIYEKGQFQLNFDPLMFDRFIACPHNFELQKTEMEDEYILKDVSKIILNKKSNNILEITKGLYSIVKTLDKYTINTQNLDKKTLRFRNVVLNAKDPISLFERDIPRAFGYKFLSDCDRNFLDDLKKSLQELKNCIESLIKDIKSFLFKEFKSKSKEELAQRFILIKEFLNEKDLKVLFNTITELDATDNLWTNRVATFINKARVPKDWSDEDLSDFKIKTKELALKLFVLESTVGTNESLVSEKYHKVLNSFLNLSKSEQNVLLRKVINL